ncbi:hypothetical protein A3D80_02780 [Candidatus Roizmanbacteria bacterium RIFCSPHIGHO2_02_FULL_40_13b]|nr:MAG: hypothetical protein A3D80_02780 [Candidatus Roizmanbacteria bacterium RIFCSPHIGHO2_02_FULL_40_13b]OGK49275.1 MAG: hypothetical protein A3A56_00610 [Candidatus Roizmanbacteria bacterium RIFCSPLOWO2_01_FULL_40_32]
MKWYNGKVIHGEKMGRFLGFPTINIYTKNLSLDFKTGIYAARVKVGEKQYAGSLFYGPRLIKKETENVLEIFLLDFEGDLYEKKIEFSPVKFIREVRDFSSLEELAKQMEEDVKKTREIIEN